MRKLFSEITPDVPAYRGNNARSIDGFPGADFD